MANPFPVLTVKIKTYDPSKLSGQLIPDSNRENIINQLKNATVWLPNWAYPLKDGDEVTVVGRQAFDLYQIINQLNAGGTSTVEALYFGAEPDVLNFVLTENLLTPSFSWTPNSIYRTYAEYKIENGDWVVIGSFDKGVSSSTFDFTGIAQIDQIAYIRLRFGNGTDFFSSWNTQSVSLSVPPVEDIVITGTEYPYVFDFAWAQNDTYYTYTAYKVNDGAWVEYATAPPSINSGQADASSVMTLGDTLHIRLRFGDGVNYGAWSEESITPYTLFAGNALPNLNDFSNILYPDYPTPVLTLYDNNVVVDHPEYIQSFSEGTSFNGSFDFRACSNIYYIRVLNIGSDCTGCQIDGCVKLEEVVIQSTDLSGGFDLTGFNLLNYLFVNNCSLANTNFLETLPNKTTLQELYCRLNNFTTASITNFTNLTTINISSNASLDSLDLTGCGSLEGLTANNCALTSLTLTGCVSLLNFNVSNNLLTSLDLSPSSNYNYIFAQNNSISSITIANGTTNDGLMAASYNFENNSLSSGAITTFFENLGDGLYKKSLSVINLIGNSGAVDYDAHVATDKNWSVFLPPPTVKNPSLYQEGSTLVFEFACTVNDTYSTYSQYKINSGGTWTDIATYSPNQPLAEYFDASSYMTIGDTFYLRLRHGDGVDYGPWAELSIVTS
jgi:hypothetical protein